MKRKEKRNKGEKAEGRNISTFFHDSPLQRAAMERNRSVRRRDVTCAQYDTRRIRNACGSVLLSKKSIDMNFGRVSVVLLPRVIQLKYIDIGGRLDTRCSLSRVRNACGPR